MAEELLQAREYQLNAAQEVLQKGNSLVIMPTALGKTFVAALVAKELLSKKPLSKILFLAPTKPLAIQQAHRLGQLLSLEEFQVALVTGELAPEKRAQLYASKDIKVVSATPQTIENDLQNQIDALQLNEFSLIVFDEAHRAVGEYAYTAVAKAAHAHSQILLLGLTASPSSDEEKVREICSHLAIKHVVSKQETDEDVAPFVQKIEVDWKPVELPAEMRQLRAQVLELANEPYSVLRKLDFLGLTTEKPNKTQLLAARMRLLASQNPARYRALSLLARLMNLLHAQDLLESQGVNALKNYLLNLEKRKGESKAVKALAEDNRIKKLIAACEELVGRGIDHPKMNFLLDFLKHRVAEGKSVIVFAHYRDSVKNIFDKLNSAGVESRVLVGKSGEGMSQKQQAGAVQDFRDKLFPVLISTSIGEEGLDIPAVDSVVFYDTVPSEVRLIQRRGRTGRVRAGEAIILYTKGTKDEAYHWSSRNKEKRMKSLVEEIREEMRQTQEEEGNGSQENGGNGSASAQGQRKIGDF